MEEEYGRCYGCNRIVPAKVLVQVRSMSFINITEHIIINFSAIPVLKKQTKREKK